MARKRNPLRERGETLMLCMALMIVFAAILAVGFDLPRAIMVKTEQESALNLARQAELAPAIGIVAKSSDDPGRFIAAELTRSLRAGGYDDGIEVWFYEVPAADLPATRRVYGYEVVLRSDLDPMFARVLGADGIHVASSLVSLSMPYGESSAWRPSSSRSGVYTVRKESSTLDFASKTYADMPGSLRSELAGAPTKPANERG